MAMATAAPQPRPDSTVPHGAEIAADGLNLHRRQQQPPRTSRLPVEQAGIPYRTQWKSVDQRPPLPVGSQG